MKSKSKISYPLKLGIEEKNELISPPKKKKKKTDTEVENLINDINISEGRWINTNYEDWSHPKWQKIKTVVGVVVDRSLGGAPYSAKQEDLAVYTEYEDPVSQMVVFDLVPINSPIFDMDKEPSENLNEVYKFGQQKIRGHNYPNIPPLLPEQTPLLEYKSEIPTTLLMMGTMFATIIVATFPVMGDHK
tara:strand:- start:462 stop:1028 length:567 start_codon:yes stop_codon:yes gene_type:complete